MFLRRESFKQYIMWYPITSVILAINIGMVLAMYVYGAAFYYETLLTFGAMFGGIDVKPEWWRYVTAMFLHGSWTHLLFNSFALFVFAPPLERMLGKWRYAVYYLVCGAVGSMFSVWLHRDIFISVGASGAIFGVYAAYIFLAVFRKDIFDEPSRKTIQTIVIVGFVYSFFPGIDLWAHLGGFVGGLAAMALIVLSIRYRRR